MLDGIKANSAKLSLVEVGTEFAVMKFQGCCMCVSRLIRKCFMGVLRMFQGNL